MIYLVSYKLSVLFHNEFIFSLFTFQNHPQKVLCLSETITKLKNYN